MTRTLVRERIPRQDPRLGRHINHDSRSRAYALKAHPATQLVSIRHQRRVPIFDQGQLGSCVPNAGLGCLGTDPFWASLRVRLARERLIYDESACLAWYRQVTRADPFPGQWEPDDTGSDGLSMAKVFAAEGLISGYRHTFSFSDALAALMDLPFITGINWYTSMFDCNGAGEVRILPGATVAGGHEIVANELDMERERVWFDQSWGRFGVDGRFWLSFATYQRLLGEDGDVTVFVPLSEPAPVPTPDPDLVLVEATRDWTTRRHVGTNVTAAQAVVTWRNVKF